jgi:hypothetical protein
MEGMAHYQIDQHDSVASWTCTFLATRSEIIKYACIEELEC